MDKWRVVLYSIYFNTSVIGDKRKIFMPIFDALAALYHLECVVVQDCLLSGIPGYKTPSIATGLGDIIHFRSTDRTLITRPQFSHVIDKIFDVLLSDKEQQWIVGPQLQRYLSKSPFPIE